jgi:hypothetical protein
VAYDKGLASGSLARGLLAGRGELGIFDFKFRIGLCGSLLGFSSNKTAEYESADPRQKILGAQFELKKAR